MTTFEEKSGEKQGQRTRRFLQFLRELPHPVVVWDNEKRKFVAREEN